jgi:hypothetical protein
MLAEIVNYQKRDKCRPPMSDGIENRMVLRDRANIDLKLTLVMSEMHMLRLRQGELDGRERLTYVCAATRNTVETGIYWRENYKVAKLSLISVVVLFVANLASAGQSEKANSGSWSGVIINGNCSSEEAFAELAKCTQKDMQDAKLSLYDDTVRKVYLLDPQDQAIGHEGDSVTVSGALEGNTIHVTSLEMMTSIGLAVGQKAPAFRARDQFGQEQTLETLKGSHGTVLLFFRSADW